MDDGDRLIDGEAAGKITGVKSRSRRYALIAFGKFPKPVKVPVPFLASVSVANSWPTALLRGTQAMSLTDGANEP